jgi:predicted ATPase
VIKSIEIRNYKSIEKIKIDLGRINVFIGENGAGKSNLLEAIALSGAAAAGKLDNEFLTSRGIRVTQPQLMRPRFEGCVDSDPITVSLTTDESESVEYEIQNDNKQYSPWSCVFKRNGEEEHQYIQSKINEFITSSASNRKKFSDSMHEYLTAPHVIPETKKKQSKKTKKPDFISSLLEKFRTNYYEPPNSLNQFVVYSPENTQLRLVETESSIEPLGINGEGLIKFLSFLSFIDDDTIEGINKCLKLLGWFEEFSINEETPIPTIDIYDRYLGENKKKLDLKSANEGFLFLIFYFSLFSSDWTPNFFAVDNIDASLNPKMCSELVKQLSELAKHHEKQAILTTHNPAILDGLNLDDDEQRLFVISRNIHGFTRIKRIFKPEGKALKLSEMFMRGSLGGLPQGF